MTEYRAYFLGVDDHITDYKGLVCRDDDEAIEKARELVDARPVELWCGGRFVIRLDPGAGKLRTQ
jgi:hypothetical protein